LKVVEWFMARERGDEDAFGCLPSAKGRWQMPDIRVPLAAELIKRKDIRAQAETVKKLTDGSEGFNEDQKDGRPRQTPIARTRSGRSLRLGELGSRTDL
jgi:hypothetical protein